MKFHHLFTARTYSSFKEIETLIEKLPTTKEKGDAFEDFVFCYLNILEQKYQIAEVYKISDAPTALLEKYKLEKTDSGVDGIFKTIYGDVCGYQVKFRSNRIKPSYDELAKFWVESKYTEYRYTITNSYEITNLAKKQENHIELLVNEFENLPADFFSQLYDFCTKKRYTRQLFEPKDFQKTIIKDVVEGFSNADRGKYIAACGTGKTLTSLWIIEELGSSEILFLTPSLALIKQTLEEWAKQTKEPFLYLCVCSDKTVSHEVEDIGDIAISDMDVPVTTESEVVTGFLKGKPKHKRIIFSTYQSLEVIANAVEENGFEGFDIAIFDEAHRTAGAKYSDLFSLGLFDKYIPCQKRLFMTATERMLMPRLKQQAEESDRTIFSMDDPEVYGNTFHRLNFGEAIKLGIISDYRIVVAAIREQDIYEWIKNNTELEDDEESINAFAQVIFSQILYTKAIKNYGISKTITFHSSIKNSQIFTSGLYSKYDLKSMVEKFDPEVPIDNFYINHIDGSFTAGRRREILDEFKQSPYGLVSNSRCLTEGIDVPVIDSIYFVDPKNSLIDIVQASGRALRKPPGYVDKIAYIMLPILIPEGIDDEELFNSEKFDYIFNVIQALRDQDDRLEQWIDLLNRNVSKGRYTKPEWTPIDIDLPESFDLNKFEKSLLTRIAVVNSEPIATRFRRRRVYGRNERRSNYVRIFTPIGDYGMDSIKNNLVDPTIKKFDSKDHVIPSSELKFSNNNVSHTRRMGIIEEVSRYEYKLSPLGYKYYQEELSFTDLFKHQILKYYKIDSNDGDRILFPYRALMQILLSTKEIGRLHFTYPISSMYDSSEKSIAEVIDGIEFINQEYPNPEVLNEANQRELVADFNSLWNVDHSYENVWTNRTTMYNQFVYFRNHLCLFDDCIESDPVKRNIKLIEGKEEEIIKLLAGDSDMMHIKDADTLISRYINYISIFLVSLGGLS